VLSGPTDRSKELKARLISGSLILLSGSSLATVLNLLYNIAVAHFLGPKGFGNATAVYTVLTITSAVTLSFQIISAKAVAQQSSEISRDVVYRDLHRDAWGCGVLVAVILILFSHEISNYLNLPNSILVVLLAVGVAFYIPLGTRRGYIQGAYGFRSLARNLVLEGAVRLIGSVMMILLGYGVVGVVGANAVAIIVAYLAIAPKLAPLSTDPHRSGFAFREISQAMVFFSGQVLINNCDIVLVKHFFDAQNAGLYAAVAMVGRVIFAFSTAVVNSMFPIVAGSDSEERKNLSLIATSISLVLGVGCLFAVGLLVAPSWIWPIFFGSGFTLAGPHGFPFLLALYAIMTVIYSLSVVIITYEMSYKIANTSWVQLVFSGVLIASICGFHGSLQEVILVQLVVVGILLIVVGVPFLLHSLKSANTSIPNDSRPIRLIRNISEDEVIAEFLRSDFENETYGKYHDKLRPIVFTPDMESKNENAQRRALLFLRHLALWKELPTDTKWYEISVNDADLARIRVFPRAQWRKLARGNFAITEVVEQMRRRQHSSTHPFFAKIANIQRGISQEGSDVGSVVLIGVDATEPLTIIDGNHRFVAAVLEGKIDKLRFVCGLSPDMVQCCWYTTNLISLTRYGKNLLRHLSHHPETELKNLFERSG
jgi:O-antigen/teichoic acid export membrane protein